MTQKEPDTNKLERTALELEKETLIADIKKENEAMKNQLERSELDKLIADNKALKEQLANQLELNKEIEQEKSQVEDTLEEILSKTFEEKEDDGDKEDIGGMLNEWN